MAKVIGLFKLRGSIDDLTFRKTQDGFIAGMKPGPTRERVLSHENFMLTRRNAYEFQQAIRDARLLRHALGTALYGRTGSSMNGRVNGVFYKAARRDGISDLGTRRAFQGDMGLLCGFDFNKRLPLAYALPVVFTHSLAAEAGCCRVEVPSFIARKRKDFPAGATHFRLVSGMVVIDFLRGKYREDIQRGELLPLRTKTPGVIGFEHKVERVNGQVAVQVLGMEFYRLADEYPVLVKGSALQVLEVVKTGIEATRQQGNEEDSGVQGSEPGARSEELYETRIEGELHEPEEQGSEGESGVLSREPGAGSEESGVQCHETGLSTLTIERLLEGEPDGCPFMGTRTREEVLLE